MGGLLNLSAESLPISRSLMLDIKQWSDLFQVGYKSTNPAQSGFANPLLERDFVIDGLRLAVRLLEGLGDQWLVHVNFSS